MAKARNWDSLAPAYRGRLERGGITRTAYESGANLAKARGHATTPEHPKEAQREINRERYRAYRDKRQRLVGKIYGIKERWFSDRPKWNAKRAREAVEKNQRTEKLRGIRELQAIDDNLSQWTDEDIDDYWEAQDYEPGEEQPDNPLYYH